MRIKVEVSPGELIDKLTILEIKEERIGDADKVANVRREKATLEAAASDVLRAHGIAALSAELKGINEALWEIEDRIRACEAEARFDAEFLELARAVYLTNDRRAAVKRRIDDRLGSDIPEEKSYRPYRRD